MNQLQAWLAERKIASPHVIPAEHKSDFKSTFKDTVVLWPQPGGQEQFQSCPADICLYGGEAGSGKSWSLLFDHLKWIHIPNYSGVVVRKTYSQIFDAGGLWEEAKQLFGMFRGRHTKGDKPKFVFPSGAQIFFKHSQHAARVADYWQGLQSPVISLDEVTQFSQAEFQYIMSRNRSLTGIDSYIRATCNPDPRSWVKEMIKWWIGDDGYIIPERSGVIRYFVNKDDRFIWADTPEELEERFGPKSQTKSFTFVRGYLEDNLKLLEKDPGYRASLENLSAADYKALCDGNWNEIDNPNALFTRQNFNKYRVEHMDFEKMERIVVAIDPQGTKGENTDDTGIVVVGRLSRDVYVFIDKTGNYKPIEWAKASCDLYDFYKADRIIAEKNFGGDMVESTINTYRSDIYPKLVTATKGKAVRAEPVATLYEQGLVHHVGHGLKELEDEMADYQPGQANSPNRMDALVWGVHELVIKQPAEPRIRML